MGLMANVKQIAGKVLELSQRADAPTLPNQPLTPPRASSPLGHAWPWLALVLIVCMHPGWTADQISELLAAFTPYIMLSRSK